MTVLALRSGASLQALAFAFSWKEDKAQLIAKLLRRSIGGALLLLLRSSKGQERRIFRFRPILGDASRAGTSQLFVAS